MIVFLKKALMLLFLLPAIASAQQKTTVSGRITEKGSGETLIGVNIYIPSLKSGTVSNAYGFYSLTFSASEETEIVFSYVGFASQSIRVKPGETLEQNIVLSSSVDLQEVVITDSSLNKVSNTAQMSNFSMPVEYVKEIPALLGEKDVFKALQLLPGVQKGNEGSSGLYVRGGGPDQNLIILDDATVYNANHLFGFFSLFNGDALKSIELIKGGFPARYGGRLSSVVDMNMKDGNSEKLSGEGGIGLISSRLTLEGPIVKNKSSFLVSGRRTYIDVLARPFMKSSNGVGGYYFYDFNAKLNYEFDKKNRLYLSGYFGRDKFHFSEGSGTSSGSGKFKAGLFWENATATLRWNHVFSNKVFSNASLIFSNYGLNIYEEEKYDNSSFSLDYSSGIRDLGVKYDFTYYPNTNHTIRYGVQSTWHRFKPSAVVLEITSSNEYVSEINSIHTFENSLYIEDDWKWNRWRGNVGLRGFDFISDSAHYISPEPRVAFGYMLTELSSLKASWTMMNQSVHLLSNTGMGLPTDLWVPSTRNIRPQRAWQAAFGYARDLPKGFALTVEGYYKKSDDVIGYREGASFLMISDPTDANQFSWEENITTGQGWSYGGELLLQKQKGKWTGWVGYTLSWTQLQFDELNSGQKFYAKYDRRHDISLVNMFKINDAFTISCVWVFSSGNALNLPVETYDAVPDYTDNSEWMQSLYTYYYGPKNSFRLRSYHRLDVGLQHHQKREKSEHTWELGFYNFYNRHNPYFYYVDSNYNTGANQLKQVSLFPMIPSFSYSIKF
ncbi:hypothetical protein SDC9_69925 [bioreactor metagenome]|uniref:TonB-dependent receptor plug domain-containing protein n=1 Tax=bioreactor metagenome TaxID=1076179 RepID=A0A644Y4G5_9ZZZZ